MTESEKRAYLARIKYTPPAKPSDDYKTIDEIKKMFGIK